VKRKVIKNWDEGIALIKVGGKSNSSCRVGFVFNVEFVSVK
jgi:hypothetical protein